MVRIVHLAILPVAAGESSNSFAFFSVLFRHDTFVGRLMIGSWPAIDQWLFGYRSEDSRWCILHLALKFCHLDIKLTGEKTTVRQKQLYKSLELALIFLMTAAQV